jgi:hypothetical protein
MNSSDRRLGQVYDRLRRRPSCLAIDVRILDAIPDLGELGDVGAAAEIATGAGQNNHTYVVASREVGVDVRQAMPHRQRHHIALLRPVQRHDGDASRVHLHQNVVRHVRASHCPGHHAIRPGLPTTLPRS